MKKKKSSSTKKQGNQKPNKAFFTLILLGFMLLLPVLFFGILEISLRAVDYGVDTDPFHEMPYAPGIYRDNLDYVFKYHPRTKKSETSIYRNVFAMPKPVGSIRGIVLGGSTAEGFPFASNQSFSGILETALNLFGSQNYQILNLGFSAMSSYYVRDAGAKILDFDPDFLVIYTGHNEFYGTISRSTGSSHLGNLLNMSLKEYKSFQWIFDSMAPAPNPTGTLMARQFSGSRFPAVDEMNQEVANVLEENIRVVIDLAMEKGIEVILIEPVSNLVDMAPFVSAQDSGLSQEQLERGTAILGGDSDQAENWLADLEVRELVQTTATGAYIQAKALELMGEPALDYYLLARDLDPVPFRARGALVRTLESLAGEYEDVHWINSSKSLIESYGPDILSNQIFIDHLHFNHRGQKEMAHLILKEMDKLSGMGRLDMESVQAYFEDNQQVSQSNFYLAINDYMAHDKVSDLVASPPYTLMGFPYQSPPSQWGIQRDILENVELQENLQKADNEDILDVYSDFLIDQALPQEYLLFLQAFNKINPGSPITHFSSGRFLASLGSPNQDRFALEEFRKAIGFSFDRDSIFRDIRDTLIAQGREDLLNSLEREIFGR